MTGIIMKRILPPSEKSEMVVGRREEVKRCKKVAELVTRPSHMSLTQLRGDIEKEIERVDKAYGCRRCRIERQIVKDKEVQTISDSLQRKEYSVSRVRWEQLIKGIRVVVTFIFTMLKSS